MSVRDILGNKLLISVVILLLAIAASALMPTKTCAEARDLVLASSTAGGTAGDSPSGSPSISSDGRYVAFDSYSDNFPSQPGQIQVYRKEVESLAPPTPVTPTSRNWGTDSIGTPTGAQD